MDLHDGKPHEMFLEYQACLNSIKKLGLGDGSTALDLTREKRRMEEDLEFLTASMLINIILISVDLQ